jgi:hypothetical protein
MHPDAWGDLEAEADRQTSEADERLTQEEAAAGLTWHQRAAAC